MLRASYLGRQGRLDESTTLVDQAYKLNPSI